MVIKSKLIKKGVGNINILETFKFDWKSKIIALA